MEYILWYIFVFGLAYITSQSRLFQGFRNYFKKDTLFKYAINCIVCSSAYVAAIASVFFSPSSIFGVNIILQLLINMVIGVGTTYIIWNLIPQRFE